MSTHGTSAVALVEVFAGLLGVERQAADGAAEGGGGMHGGGGVLGSSETILGYSFQCRRCRLYRHAIAAFSGVTMSKGSRESCVAHFRRVQRSRSQNFARQLQPRSSRGIIVRPLSLIAT